jgi:lipoprotein-releasing system permease protein
LNLAYFIAKRISRQHAGSFSAVIHTIAVASISVGLAAAIIAFLIMYGFQEAVKTKMYSFSGHVVVTAMSYNNSIEETPFDYNIELVNRPEKFPGVVHLQEYAHKAGLIKTNEEILGVVIKGVGKTFDTLSFAPNMIEGRFLHFPDSTASNEVVLSKTIANKLKVRTGDQLTVHFFQNPPRVRKLTVAGIYETNLSEYFDGKMIVGDIRLVQRLNDWADSIAGGLEIFVADPDAIEDVAQQLHSQIDYDMQATSTAYKYQSVFQWLQLLSRQVTILLGIILTVVCINMISIILILVMERTQMIGMLKAMGATNSLVRKVFISSGMALIARGLCWGNALGLGFCALQYWFKIIPLNARDYYVSHVPVSWHWDVVLGLNVLMFVVVAIVLLVPTMVIARISPVKAITFD